MDSLTIAMIFKSCLLVSDDPDDHQEFSDAIYELSGDTAVMCMSSPDAALKLIKYGMTPDYVFVDLSIENLDPNNYLSRLMTAAGSNPVQVVIYGDDPDLVNIKTSCFSDFFNRAVTYGQLKELLATILKL